MSLFIGFLTVILVLDAAFLILLVLIQLPKKEAGLGTAFGGGMTDALFGAGTGNVLTKATKWSAGIFLCLSLILSILNTYAYHQSGKARREQLLTPGAAAPMALPTSVSNATPEPLALPLTSTSAAPATATPATPAPATKAPAPAAPTASPPADKQK